MNIPRLSNVVASLALCAGLSTTAVADQGKAKLQQMMGIGVLAPAKAAQIGPEPRGAPPNDDCLLSELLPCDSSVTFDNTLATTVLGDPLFSCYFGAPTRGTGTMWYHFVATDVSAELKTCNSQGSDDTLIAVYPDMCPTSSAQELGCSEDFCGFLSKLCVDNLTVGNTYYVQVASFDAASRGEITLDLACPCPTLPPPPTNDTCQQAEPLTLVGGSVTVIGQTLSAGPDTVVDCDTAGNAEAPGVWYTVTGTGNTMTASSCLNTDYDAKIFIYCGTDCFDLVCVANDDDSCSGQGSPAEASWCSTAGQTYWIFMHGSGTSTGNFELTVSDDGLACADPPPCVPQGACCIPKGADPNAPECSECIIVTESECLVLIAGLQFGEYKGDGTVCGQNCIIPIDCPACCDAASNQCSLEAPGLCIGTVLPNIFSCDTAPCVFGACCFETGCQENMDLTTCQSNGGVFLGGGSDCTGAVCTDFCEAALAIPCDSTTTADNTNAILQDPSDPNVECFFGGPQIGFGSLWYKFVATDTSARLNTDNSPTPADDSQISVYAVQTFDPCNTLSFLACSEDEGVGLLSDLCVQNLTVGNTYYVMLTAFSPATVGPYELELECPCPCTPVVQCCVGDADQNGAIDGRDVGAMVDAIVNPPAACSPEACKFDPNLDGHINLDDIPGFVGLLLLGPDCPADDCANAVPITDGLTPFTTLGATTDGPEHPNSLCNAFLGDNGAVVNDIWYIYTATCTGTVRIETCNNGGLTPGNTDYDTRIAIYDGTACANLVLIECNDDGLGCAGFSSDLSAPVTAGSTYLVRIGGFPTESGTGQVNITCSTP